jgi:regulator of protease activity HflC (stomatin/prohibitin superfamily)
MAQQLNVSSSLPVKKIGLIIGTIIFALIALFTSFRQVNTGQIGVVTRFGKVTGKEVGEGLHIIMPFGIEQLTIYDVKVAKLSDDIAAATKDLQDVNATIALNYRVEAGAVSGLHQTVGPLFVEKIVEPAVNEVFKAATAQYSAAELLAKRPEVKQTAVEGLKERLSRYGISVDDLSIVNFKFSDTFTKAIEEKQAAEQNVQRARFNLEAAQADSQAQQVQAQTLSPLFLQKQAIDKWDGRLPTYLGQGSVFNIPLQ